MSLTRAKSDLKNTSIHQHLLEPKESQKKKQQQSTPTNMVDHLQALTGWEEEREQKESKAETLKTPIDQAETKQTQGSNKKQKDGSGSAATGMAQCLVEMTQSANQDDKYSTDTETRIMGLMEQTTKSNAGKTRAQDKKQVITTTLPTFSGAADQEPEEWLMRMKFLLKQETVESDQQLHLIVCHLRGVAFKWFYRRQEELKDLERFEEKFLEQFTPNEQGNHGMFRQTKCRSTSDDGENPSSVSNFEGSDEEDAGQWLDQILAWIEQRNLTPIQQRNYAAGKLTGAALAWYRMNRLRIPDMEIFTRQFLQNYNLARTPTNNRPNKHEDQHMQQVSEHRNERSKPKGQGDSSSRVLQAAKNEKVKILPNFSGIENSMKWVKNVEQTGRSLQLNQQQVYELATIKLIGAAQEWLCYQQQEEEIEEWERFKDVFLDAFPPPSEPSNIDYLSQLLSRKQGANEQVGKYVQDINRLCLKLEKRVDEHEKLQYLRRGLRPQLQHHALSIHSVQDFLTVLQRHEQIEKETIVKQQLNTRSEKGNASDPVSRNNWKPRWTNEQQPHDYNDNQGRQHTQASGSYVPTHQPSNYPPGGEASPSYNGYNQQSDERLCYQCNKPGHMQRNCPDYQPDYQQQSHFQGRGH